MSPGIRRRSMRTPRLQVSGEETPAVESKTFSVSNWRMTRQRLAPRAVRIASSRLRLLETCEQQIGNIGASDEQHQGDGPEQNVESFPNVTDNRLAHRYDATLSSCPYTSDKDGGSARQPHPFRLAPARWKHWAQTRGIWRKCPWLMLCGSA